MENEELKKIYLTLVNDLERKIEIINKNLNDTEIKLGEVTNLSGKHLSAYLYEKKLLESTKEELAQLLRSKPIQYYNALRNIKNKVVPQKSHVKNESVNLEVAQEIQIEEIVEATPEATPEEVIIQHDVNLESHEAEIEKVISKDLVAIENSRNYLEIQMIYRSLTQKGIQTISMDYVQKYSDLVAEDLDIYNIIDYEKFHSLAIDNLLCDENLNIKVSSIYDFARLISLIRMNFGGQITLQKFLELADFAAGNAVAIMEQHRPIIHEDLFHSFLAKDYNDFIKHARPKLLIAGYDLKFILPLVPFLEERYIVKIDEWKGHNTHNEKASLEFLNWADIVFCEWALGNAVWYSSHIMTHQKLIVRAHKFEMFLDFGRQIDFKKVDAFIAISVYCYEKFIELFHLPRHKAVLLPNFIINDHYSKSKTFGHQYNIALVGSIPKMKGYRRALELLNSLVKEDANFRLHIFGAGPTTTKWIWENPEEREYYLSCDKYIEDNGLRDSIVSYGWVNVPEALKNIGCVLSLSDNVKPEGSHQAIADGLFSGANAYILRWSGCEYIYHESIIYESMQDIKSAIIESMKNGGGVFPSASAAKKAEEMYGVRTVLGELFDLLRRIY